MTQTPLNFDAPIGEFVREGARSEQARELKRVRTRTDSFILDFFRERGIGAQFYMSDLLAYIRRRIGGERKIAPGSPDRIMRAMRATRHLDYTVINRAHSHYEITGIGNNK